MKTFISDSNDLSLFETEKIDSYWNAYLRGYEQHVDIPKLRSKGAEENTSWQEVAISFSLSQSRQLKQFAHFCKTSKQNILRTAWGILLQKYNDVEDCVYGELAYEKEEDKYAEGNPLICPVRIQTDQEITTHHIIQNVHQHVASYGLTRYLKIDVLSSVHHLLSNAVLTFADKAIVNTWLAQAKEHSSDDLYCVIQDDEQISFSIVYREQVYAISFIQQLTQHFMYLLEQMVEKPFSQPRELELNTYLQTNTLLQCNQNAADYPKHKSIVELFEQQVSQRPNHPALYFEHQQLTYEQLDHASNQLARHLLAHGVSKGDFVSVMMQRSPMMIITVLGILKTGAAYVPIDPIYPQERIQYILSDSMAPFFIVDKEVGIVDLEYEGQIISIDALTLTSYGTDSIGRRNEPEDVANIIYTSGSTGKPKGTLITHQNIIKTMINGGYVDITPEDKLLQLSSFAFDAFTFDMHGALLNGAQLVLIKKEVLLSPTKLSALIKQEQISVMLVTTALFHVLVDVDVSCLKDVRNILFGGEKCSIEHVRKAWDIVGPNRLVNMYGPTETTVYATYYPIQHIDASWESVPIGKPVHNTKVYILNKQQQLQPMGIPGELYIGGDGVANGYLHRESLSKEKFMKDPFIPGAVMYRSGDRARWLPDGSIEFMDRLDQQVKIRGHRIEIGEIEKQLLVQPMVQTGVVMVSKDGHEHSFLTAYVVLHPDASMDDVKQNLARTLPPYMMPTYFISLPSLPLTANGKVDKRALPDPEQHTENTPRVKPSNATEEMLVAMWKEVLHLSTISTNDHFFKIGGNSLKAMLLLAKINQQMRVELTMSEVFDMPTIQALAKRIQHVQKTNASYIQPVLKTIEEQAYYPVSSAQKQMYAIQTLDETSCSYNVPLLWKVEGVINKHKWLHALQSIVNRHEILRTSFHLIEGELMQKVHPSSEISYAEVHVKCEEEIDEAIASFISPFSFHTPKLLRAGFIYVNNKLNMLIIDMHHMITDGTSMELFKKELSAIYEGKEVPSLAHQYKTYAVWQHDMLQSERLQKQKQFWLEQFEGEPPILQLPTDFQRGIRQTFEGSTFTFQLEKSLTQSIYTTAAKYDVTTYMLLLAAYHVLLSKCTGQHHIVVGTAVAGRSHSELNDVIGMFVNSLPLQIKSDKKQSFEQFLKMVKANVLQAYDNADYPFERLVEELGHVRDASRNPLFDTMFILQNIDRTPLHISGVTLQEQKIDSKHARLDLTWELIETANHIDVTLEYNTALFTEDTIARMAEQYRYVLQQLINSPTTSFVDIELVPPRQKNQIVEQFNDTKTPFHEDKTIQQMFEHYAQTIPETVAVVFKDQQLTYRELNRRANDVALVLRENGVKVDQFVGVMVERSLEMIVSIFAVLKAGGAYVPIDPTYPAERIQYMLEDSETNYLLTQSHISVPSTFKGQKILVDIERFKRGRTDIIEHWNTPQDLAYMIYTSGSTGKPKGVMIEHQGVCSFQLIHSIFGMGRGNRVLQFASLSFDASVAEIFLTLLSGGTLYVEEKNELISNLVDYMERNEITSAILPPSMLRNLEYRDLPHLKTLITAGEACSLPLIKTWGKGRTYVNGYGPTEGTVGATNAIFPNGEGSLSIGKPVPNMKIMILNEDNQLQPIGVTGELCIGGVGLARGYWKRPDLTAEKFIDSPFNSNEKIYKTGDLAHWLPDGNIQLLGRMDHQVKINGHRIECNEITEVILKHPDVHEAIVMDTKESDSVYLCAYIVVVDTGSITAIRKYVSDILPQYMVPSYFVPIEKLPLTANDKVDRKALPDPKQQMYMDSSYKPPTNAMETKLASIWEDVLDVEKVGVNDVFLALGGDSIKAIQIAARLNNEQYHIDIKDVYEYATIAELAPMVKRRNMTSEQCAVEGHVPLTPIQTWFFEQHLPICNHWNQAVMLQHEQRWNAEKINEVFSHLVKHHDALRMCYTLDAKVKQMNNGVEHQPYSLHVYEHDACDDVQQTIAQEANRLQKMLNIEKGQLMQLGLFHSQEKDYLLIVIHHLVIDGVSWRILLEDFHTAYEQLRNGKSISLPKKTDSFQAWSQQLIQYRRSKELEQESVYWKAAEGRDVPSLPKDRNGNTICYLKDSKTVSIHLSEKDTNDLLTNIHGIYHTEMNDVLLAALIMALQKSMHITTSSILLEGHGREEIGLQMNVSRTIGWFTSMYPVHFTLPSDKVADVIMHVKETLRSVPNKGIGYSVLKYLSSAEHSLQFKHQPEISFNYLGRFNQHESEGGLQLDTTLTGEAFHPLTPLTAAIDINGMIEDDKLKFVLRYNPHLFLESTMTAFATRYEQSLLDISQHCMQQEHRVYTPSDFTAEDISVEELDNFLNMLD
ncbi:non-ribosomal peptide synthetase [Longirhabdus pacifica]|uniref:non-ribosomal peptide synthetase n=1 Tax=Longirhabdus pacifica TaxID=2305227 RepID=UPI001008CDFB|nr:non-ribosomal peptide synthetase [Longirhabdus pacifica]